MTDRSMESVTSYGHLLDCHVTFGRGDFKLVDEFPVKTTERPKRRFQTFPYTSLSKTLIRKTHRNQDKEFIKEVSPSVSDQL